VKRRPSGGMNLNIRSMLYHTSGVPFASTSGKSVGDNVGIRVLISPVRIRYPARGSATPPSRRAFLGRQTDKRQKVKGCNLRYLGSADPAVRVRFPSEPRGSASRDHKQGSRVPPTSVSNGNRLTAIRPAPQKSRVPRRVIWTAGDSSKNPGVRLVGGRSRSVAGLRLLILLTLCASRTPGRHHWIEP
jgi:hypothetical protein